MPSWLGAAHRAIHGFSRGFCIIHGLPCAPRNPWIFKRILHYLKTGELLPEPTAQERVEKALRHSQMLIAYKGEYIGIREMRKHMAWYMKGLPGAAELRGKLNYAETMAEMEALLNEYLKNHQ